MLSSCTLISLPLLPSPFSPHPSTLYLSSPPLTPSLFPLILLLFPLTTPPLTHLPILPSSFHSDPSIHYLSSPSHSFTLPSFFFPSFVSPHPSLPTYSSAYHPSSYILPSPFSSPLTPLSLLPLTVHPLLYRPSPFSLLTYLSISLSSLSLFLPSSSFSLLIHLSIYLLLSFSVPLPLFLLPSQPHHHLPINTHRTSLDTFRHPWASLDTHTLTLFPCLSYTLSPRGMVTPALTDTRHIKTSCRPG